MTESISNNYRIIEDIKISEGENIETLYKAKPPFVQAEDAKAPMGVLLWNRVTDTVKCHVCGKWLKQINFLHLRTHRLDHELYRNKFGFNSSNALCSRGTSRKHSEMITSERKESLRRGLIASGYKPSMKIGQNKHGLNQFSYRNSYATCEEQIKKRIQIVALQSRSEGAPSSLDLKKHDNALLKTIEYRWGTWTNYVEKNNLKMIRRKQKPMRTDEFMLCCLREAYGKNHNRITMNTFGKIRGVSLSVIRDRFGSWRRALAMAGLT